MATSFFIKINGKKYRLGVKAAGWKFVLNLFSILMFIEHLLSDKSRQALSDLHRLVSMSIGAHCDVDQFGRLIVKSDDRLFDASSKPEFVSILKKLPWMLAGHQFFRWKQSVCLTISIPEQIITEDLLFSLIRQQLESNENNYIKDEYGERYTMDQFLEIVRDDPSSYSDRVDYATRKMNAAIEKLATNREEAEKQIRADGKIDLCLESGFVADFHISGLTCGGYIWLL